jgi:hypothetical protein
MFTASGWAINEGEQGVNAEMAISSDGGATSHANLESIF